MMQMKTAYPVINLAETGRCIERRRRQAGLTVRELQAYFGFEYPQAIYKWQHGECLPTVDNLLALAKILRVSMEDLLVYEDQGGSHFLGKMLQPTRRRPDDSVYSQGKNGKEGPQGAGQGAAPLLALDPGDQDGGAEEDLKQKKEEPRCSEGLTRVFFAPWIANLIQHLQEKRRVWGNFVFEPWPFGALRLPYALNRKTPGARVNLLRVDAANTIHDDNTVPACERRQDLSEFKSKKDAVTETASASLPRDEPAAFSPETLRISFMTPE